MAATLPVVPALRLPVLTFLARRLTAATLADWKPSLI
jgi:hypothetical protein